MKTYTKFAVLIVAVIGTLVWLAMGGINESSTYYKEIAELEHMGDQAMGKRLRVGGDVEPGSILRDGRQVHFVLTQENHRLRVVYEGSDPLPDTFRDRAQALADGKMGSDGVFRASKIQAKCASKYEAQPGTAPASRAPASS
ncbi:MAG: cytochrome c maturation protein CcmE [Bryobacteraceae bacterium]|nr:cytochrome c maturation protein CcmE [Bryobacteraceae bacterium]